MAFTFEYNHTFILESGISLPGFQLAYTTHGILNDKKDNVVWIFHALTANCDPLEWWPGLTGEQKLFDPASYFIVCVNMPGSCYGSFSPLHSNPANQQAWLHDFPYFTTRDMIRAYQPLRTALGIEKIHIGIGGSMGGQQLLEWAVEEPSLFENMVLLATNAAHSPWGIAFNATQRAAIELDPSWQQANPLAGMQGMMVARQVALLSYRNFKTYGYSQSEENPDKTNNFKSESYQRYQGEKLAKRFNAFSYYFLSKSMDSHNVGRHRGGIQAALSRVVAKTLVISISSDILFPPVEQETIVQHIKEAIYCAIDSTYGHDGFLLEYDQIAAALRQFLPSSTSAALNPPGSIPVA